MQAAEGGILAQPSREKRRGAVEGGGRGSVMLVFVLDIGSPISGARWCSTIRMRENRPGVVFVPFGRAGGVGMFRFGQSEERCERVWTDRRIQSAAKRMPAPGALGWPHEAVITENFGTGWVGPPSRARSLRREGRGREDGCRPWIHVASVVDSCRSAGRQSLRRACRRVCGSSPAFEPGSVPVWSTDESEAHPRRVPCERAGE